MSLAVNTRPQHLSATSLSSRIAPLFDQTGHGAVIATFGRSCYFELHGRIVAFVAAELLNGPLNLVALLPLDATLLHLPVGGTVAVAGRLVEIAGHVRIDTTAARRWNPRIHLVRGAPARGLARALASIQTILASDAPQESFARAAARPRRAADAMVRLAGALRTGNAALAGRAADDLAGLGPGLTPSGDDVLAGVLLALALLEPPYARAVRAQIVASVRDRTTRISEAYLEAAADGDSGEPWHRLVDIMRRDEVLGGDDAGGGDETANFDAAVRQIMTFGETSGADMLTGFVLGMTALGPAKTQPT